MAGLAGRVAAIFGVLATGVAAVVVYLHCPVDSPSNGDCRGPAALDSGLHGCEAELLEITNGITRDFRSEDMAWSHIPPCVYETSERVKIMTNDAMRLAVARHIAGETLLLDLTNGNYRIRDLRIHGMDYAIPVVYWTLRHAKAREKEVCDFVFDALAHFKEGATFTLDEIGSNRIGKIYTDAGIKYDCERYTCANAAESYLQYMPGNLKYSIFNRMYADLPPRMKEYFKKRFFEVFGMAYLPDFKGRETFIKGLEGARWDGTGLEWRVCEGGGKSRPATDEDFNRERNPCD